MELRSKERLIVLLVACVLAVALTWPVAAHFASAGRLDTGDGRYSIWNVAWVARALTTDPWELFQANIFHPHENALAFSEANLVAGVMAVPVWLLTTNALAASNWTILCSFALSFFTTYLLVRRLTGSVAGAAIAALHFAYSPFVFAHIPHVQLLMTFPLPLVMLMLHGFVEAPALRRAVALGAALALQALASGYYGFFAGLVTALGIVWLGVAFGHWRSARYWVLSATAAVVAVAIVAPFFLPYLGVREDGFARTLEDTRLHSVRWRAYLASPILVHRWMLPLIGSWREVLFPGFLPIIFTIVAISRSVGSYTLSQRRIPAQPRREPAANAGDHLVAGLTELGPHGAASTARSLSEYSLGPRCERRGPGREEPRRRRPSWSVRSGDDAAQANTRTGS